MNTEQHRRKGLRIMGALIGLVKPLLPVMILAVVLGTIGYLCAIFSDGPGRIRSAAPGVYGPGNRAAAGAGR